MARPGPPGDPAGHRRRGDALARLATSLLPAQPAYRRARHGRRPRPREHYRDHPALASGISTTSTPATSASASARHPPWPSARGSQTLRKRSTRLNDAWGTAFWSQIYGDWQEIEPPRRAPTFVNPGQQLDWQRFCSDSWLACFEDQRQSSARSLPTSRSRRTSWAFTSRSTTGRWRPRERRLERQLPEHRRPRVDDRGGMTCDLIRSLGEGRPWMLMEQATGHVNWRERNATKSPGIMRLAATRRSPGAQRRRCSSSGERRRPAARSSTARCCPTAAPRPASGAR